MKQKKIKKIIMVLAAFWMLVIQCLPVRAQGDIVQVDLPFGIINDPNSKWAVGLSKINQFGNYYDTYGRIEINGKKVYCIEPLSMTLDSSDGYTAEDLGVYFGNSALAKKLEYISALGYGFQGDVSHEMDFATQVRLWQEISPGLITRVHPEIQAKIDQINERLRIMETDVFFDGQSLTFHGYGKEFAQTLVDTNNVLSAYTVEKSSLHYEQEGNNLTLWMEPGDAGQLTMNCFYPYQGTSIAYRNPVYQDVAYITGGVPNQLTLKAKVQLGSIQIAKKDKDTGMIVQGDASLVDAQYEVIDNKTQQVVGTLSIRNDLSSNLLTDLPTDRTYTIREIKAPKGYLKDDTAYIVDLNKENDVVLEVRDKVITGRFSIHKILTDKEHSQVARPEMGAEFTAILKRCVDQYGSFEEAWKHKDSFLDSEWDVVITDNNGKATSKELAFGEYVIKQTAGPEETHLLQEQILFKVEKENQEVIEYTVNNRPYSYYLRLVKVDKETGKPIILDGATFEILDEEGQRVEMKVGSKTFDIFKTASKTSSKEPGLFVAQDEEGTLTLPLKLNAGNYIIQEIASPKGYLIDSDPIEVKIGSSYVSNLDETGHPVIEVRIENERPKGKLILHKKFEGGLEEESCPGKVVFQLTAKEDIKNPYDGNILYKKGEYIDKDHEEGLYTMKIGKPLEIDHLEMGSYLLTEVETIEGFQLYEEPIEICFVQEGDKRKEILVEKTIENQRIKIDTKVKESKEGRQSFYQDGKIKLIDQVRYQGLDLEQEYILEGKIIDLETEEIVKVDDQEVVQTLHFVPEGSSGTIDHPFLIDSEKWEPGSYGFYETLYCTKGHKLASHEDPEDPDQQFKLIPLFGMKIYKVDAKSQEKIKDKEFTFELFEDEACTQKVQDGIWDGNASSFYWEGLKPQIYYLKETKAPDGYHIDKDIYAIEVKEDGIYVDDKVLSKEEDFYIYRFENEKIPQIPTSESFSHKGLWMLCGFSGLIIFLIILLGIQKKKHD